MNTTESTIIPKNLIEGANNNSFFNRGSGLERDAQNASAYFDNAEEIKKLEKRLGGFTDEQQALLYDRSLSWKALVKEQYTAQAQFNASNVPWFIAGPANYNNRRYQKLLDAAENKYKEYNEKRQRFIKNTIDMLLKLVPAEKQVQIWKEGKQAYNWTIAADDPLAVEKMEAHIEYLKAAHEKHLKINAYIRKHGTAKGMEGITDLQAEKLDAEASRIPWRRGHIYFTDNESADIRSKTKRLEQLKKHRAIAEEEKAEGLKLGTMEKEGLRLEENHEAARVQLFFDGMPDEETRAKLKANGFRWSPRFGAWQRQNTPNGMAVARQFFESYKAA